MKVTIEQGVKEIEILGLPVGEYVLTVTARNEAGVGTSSVAVNIPATSAPSAPIVIP